MIAPVLSQGSECPGDSLLRRLAPPPADTLRRTPLSTATLRGCGREARPVRGLGDARAVRGHPRGARGRAHAARASSTSRTWARSRRAGPEREAFLQRMLSNDVAKLADRAARSTRVLCREDGGVLDDLFTYRLADDRFLTVTNAANHEQATSPGSRDHADAASTSRSIDRIADYAMLAVQGPQARAIVAGARPTAQLPARMHTADAAGRRASRRSSAAPATPARTASSCCCAPERRARACGTRWSRRARRPPGLGARDTLRLEVCFHLYGNDLMRGPRPDRGGPRAGAARRTRASSAAEAVARRPRGRPGEQLVPFASPARASRARATRCVGGGVVTSGTLSPWLGVGIGMAYVPRASGAQPGTRDRDRRARQGRAPPRSSTSPSTERRRRVADAATPTTCCTTPSTTGRGSTATTRPSASPGTRRTRSARSCSSTRPRSARTVSKDEAYAEVESVKAVSDVIAPLSGEIVEVNEALGDAPEKINDDPYGEGWLVQGASSPIPSEGDALLDADGVQGAARLSTRLMSTLHLRHRRRPRAMLDAIGVGVGRGAVRRRSRPRVRLERAARPAGRHGRAGGLRAPARAGGAQRHRRGRDHLPRRGHVRPLRAGDRSTRSSRARSS